MRVHFIQHVAFEDPAAIRDWATQHGHASAETHLYAGQPLPELDAFDLLVIMGGPMSVHDEADYSWLRAEKAFVRGSIAAGRGVLGICLGAQLIADALGSRVYKGPEREIGWFPVRRTDSSGVGAALPEQFTPLHWHGETFDLPSGAVRLAASEIYPNQAFQFESKVVGLQFHLEATPASTAAMVTHCSGEITGGRFQQLPEQIADCEEESRAARGLLFEILDLWSEASEA